MREKKRPVGDKGGVCEHRMLRALKRRNHQDWGFLTPPKYHPRSTYRSRREDRVKGANAGRPGSLEKGAATGRAAAAAMA